MGVGIGNTAEAFDLLYRSLWQRDFRKSVDLHKHPERKLLPLVRTFLLGYFGESLVPEASSVLPGSLSGYGRIDFLVGDVAVEFVVRRPSASRHVISPDANITEVKKLLKHDGHALLVIYDFSLSPLTAEDLEGFRELPSLGRGRHVKSPFNLAYYYRERSRPIRTGVVRKNIQAGRVRKAP